MMSETGSSTDGSARSGEIVSGSATHHDQLLYYTSHSLREDDQHLQVISDRSGQPNVYAVDLETGEQTQRTFCDRGILKQYVYFDGTPYEGIGVASISAHRGDGSLYYIHGREVRKVDPVGVETVLNVLPDDQMTAYTHVSWDGRRLCIPTTDERALEGAGIDDYIIDQRVQDEGLSSYLAIYDTETGEELSRTPAPVSWITHAQFSPTNPEQILVEYEWPLNPGIRYLWLFDLASGERIQLRDEEDGRSGKDRVCHPVWSFDGQHILYHGGFHNGPTFIGRMNPDGSDIREVAFADSYRGYGHFNVSRSGQIVSDGYYHTPGEAGKKRGEWISLLDVDWERRSVDWHPLCRHHALWNNQDSHPHPIFSDAEDAVYYTGSHNPGGTSRRVVCRIGL